MTVDFREQARGYLKASQSLLESGEIRQVFYACFEVRLAIEALTYDLLQIYRQEINYSVMAVWQPGRILDELTFVDEDSSKPITLSITSETGEVISFGEDYRFSPKWAKKAHSALGSFLHQPTLRQVEASSNIERAHQAISKIAEISTELNKVLSSTVRHSKISRLVKQECVCGFVIARDVEYLELGKPVFCAGCNRHWRYSITEDKERIRFEEVGFNVKCPYCNEDHATRSSIECQEGRKLQCDKCGGWVKLARQFSVERCEPD